MQRRFLGAEAELLAWRAQAELVARAPALGLGASELPGDAANSFRSSLEKELREASA